MTGSPNEPGAEPLPEADARRPRVITVAFWVLITSTVFWVPVSGSSAPGDLQGTSAILCVYVWCAARVRRGRWTARILGTAAAVWLVVVQGSRTPGFMDAGSPYGWEYAVMDLMAVILTGTGVALLYGREGNTYFRRRPW
ncbi:hypothetical protein ABZ307_30380 [Streptomyces griseorubiginosus]|uniref:hypothetical protein n=1 Tax=Streptomyces griseorubiginosus TaxID=67304 RepID=UPI0033B83CF8